MRAGGALQPESIEGFPRAWKMFERPRELAKGKHQPEQRLKLCLLNPRRRGASFWKKHCAKILAEYFRALWLALELANSDPQPRGRISSTLLGTIPSIPPPTFRPVTFLIKQGRLEEARKSTGHGNRSHRAARANTTPRQSLQAALDDLND